MSDHRIDDLANDLACLREEIANLKAARWSLFDHNEIMALRQALSEVNEFYASYGVVRQCRRLLREARTETQRRGMEPDEAAVAGRRQ